MSQTVLNISDQYAYDISKNPVSVGEVWDVDVINQSIELILSTYPGERLFNPSFGLGLERFIFNLSTSDEAENLLNMVANAIKTWEDRITLFESQMRLISNTDQNTVILIIPYQIKINQITSVFMKKIASNS